MQGSYEAFILNSTCSCKCIFIFIFIFIFYFLSKHLDLLSLTLQACGSRDSCLPFLLHICGWGRSDHRNRVSHPYIRWQSKVSCYILTVFYTAVDILYSGNSWHFCVCATGLMDPGKCQVVLAGDPKQLGPVISSRMAEDNGFGEQCLSLFKQIKPIRVCDVSKQSNGKIKCIKGWFNAKSENNSESSSVFTSGNLKKATLCRSVHVGASDEGHWPLQVRWHTWV